MLEKIGKLEVQQFSKSELVDIGLDAEAGMGVKRFHDFVEKHDLVKVLNKQPKKLGRLIRAY